MPTKIEPIKNYNNTHLLIRRSLMRPDYKRLDKLKGSEVMNAIVSNTKRNLKFAMPANFLSPSELLQASQKNRLNFIKKDYNPIGFYGSRGKAIKALALERKKNNNETKRLKKKRNNVEQKRLNAIKQVSATRKNKCKLNNANVKNACVIM